MEKELAALVELISEGLIYQGADGRIRLWNRAAEKIFGLGKEQATGLTSTDHEWNLINEDGSPCPGEKHPSMLTLASGQALCDQVRGIKHRGGGVTWLSINTQPVFEPGQDQPSGVVISFRDISQQKAGQEALRQSEERYRQLVRHAPAGIYEIDLTTGRFLSVNDVMCLYTGYSREEFLALNALDILTPESAALFRQRQTQLGGGQELSPSVEFAIRAKNGGLFHVLLNVSVQRRPDGRMVASVVAHDITLRKRAEEDLRETLARNRSLLEGVSLSGIMLFVVDGGYRVRYMNQPMIQAFGDCVGQICYQAVARAESPCPHCKLGQVVKDGQSARYEVSLVDGRVFDISAVPYVDTDGTPCKLEIIEDITQRKKAEEDLRANEEKFRLVFDSSPDAAFLTRPDGSILAANPEACRMFGYSQQEILRLGRDGIVDTSDPRLAELVARRAQDGAARGECTGLRKGGQAFPVEVSSRIYRGGGGQVMSCVMVRDITQRKQAEEDLRLNQDRLQVALATVDLAVFHQDRDLRYTWMYKPQLGYDTSQVVGHTDAELLPAQDAALVMEIKRGVLKSGRGARQEVEVGTNGGTLTFDLVVEPLLDENGEVVGITGSSLNITQRKRAEEERRITAEVLGLINAASGRDELLRDVLASLQVWSGCQAVGMRLRQGLDFPYFETSGFPPQFVRAENRLCAQDQEGRLLRDPSGEPLLECMCGNIIQGRFDPALPFFTPGGSFYSNCTSELLATTTPEQRQARTRNRCNGEGYESVALIPLRSGGQTFGLIQLNDKRTGRFSAEGIALLERLAELVASYLAKDQAEQGRTSMEAQLRQAHKMQAVGTLAAGVAHEFNNLLAVILGYAELVRDEAQGRRDILDDLAPILTACQRGRDLVKQLAAFSRQQEPQAKPLNLNQQIAATGELLARLLPRTVAVHTGLAPDLPIVGMDAGHFQQILIALANNAAQAMPAGGRLDITTAGLTLVPTVCSTCGETFAGHYARLMVCDSGPGMDPETARRVFEPFFSTKGVGGGVGLGLSVAQGIVKSYGGHIVCRSAPGQGTCMEVYLPVYQARQGAALPEEPPVPEGGGGGGETILLVDDEEALRDMGRRLLGQAGYRVLTAQSGEEALDIYGRDPAGIALVLLDLGMPGMGGQRCLQELLARQPGARVVVASGYAGDGQDQQALTAGARAFVAKPFRKSDLLGVIRQVLDQPAAP